MLSATAEHALRAIVYIARYPDQAPLAADTIAESLGAPRNYLAKTLHALAKAGILRSSRGPGGGFSLLVPAHELTIAQIIAPFGEPADARVCLLNNRACDGQNTCASHSLWHSITEQQGQTMRHTTVADLLEGQRQVALVA
jgi:Rrf2 family protein